MKGTTGGAHPAWRLELTRRGVGSIDRNTSAHPVCWKSHLHQEQEYFYSPGETNQGVPGHILPRYHCPEDVPPRCKVQDDRGGRVDVG